MATVAEALQQNRDAVREFLSAADGAAAHWTTPRAPNKWSPAQVTEHVGRALEQTSYAIAGKPTVFPVFPRFLRPIMRGVFFNRMVKSGRFPKGAGTNKPMDPAATPPSSASVAEGRARLQGGLALLEAASLAAGSGDPTVETTTFGPVSLSDYLIFQAHHTRHHRPQLQAAG